MFIYIFTKLTETYFGSLHSAGHLRCSFLQEPRGSMSYEVSQAHALDAKASVSSDGTLRESACDSSLCYLGLR